MGDTLSSATLSLTESSVQSFTKDESLRNPSITSSSTALPVPLQIEAERVQKDGSPKHFWKYTKKPCKQNQERPRLALVQPQITC